MTIGEITLIIQTFQKREETKAKEILATNYNLACMITDFIGRSLNGQSIPTIQEVYPSLQNDVDIKPQKKIEPWQIYKEQMIDYALAHNKKRKEATINDA